MFRFWAGRDFGAGVGPRRAGATGRVTVTARHHLSELDIGINLENRDTLES